MSSKTHKRSRAKLAATTRLAPSVTDESIYAFLSSLNSPRSLSVWILYSNREFEQLSELEVDPHHYNDAYRFRDDYAATSFLSKSNFLDLPISKKDAALQKFLKFEELCSQTNHRLDFPLSDPLYKGPNVWLLNATIRKIEMILGDYSGEELVDQANWGPGVTTLLKGSNVSAVNKFHSENGITSRLLSFVRPWFGLAYPGWNSHMDESLSPRWVIQNENAIVTVPKNSKTDRVIAVEPGINLWFQKGVGSMIRRRLRRVGIDLSRQEINQELARQGSKTSDLATIDFSSASDSISASLVRELLPPRWYALLDVCRCTSGIHEGSIRRWNKFSSMGNGFTFELESLIFYAAALAVKEFLLDEGTVSVYGDDVIIPVTCCELYSSFCEFLGFRTNKTKSFSSSYFRESCGSHYFDGVDCKPIFLKEKLHNAQAIYKLANSVRYFAHRRNSYYGCDVRFQRCFHRLKRRVPEPIRFCCSFGLGDVGFISNFDEAQPSVPRHGIEGFLVEGLLETGLTGCHEGTGLLLARLRDQVSTQVFRPLYSPEPVAQGFGNSYPLRGRTRLVVSTLLVPQWYNLGPWI